MAKSDDFDEVAAIGNYSTDTIYQSDFKNGAGKYFNIIVEDGNTSVEYHPPFPSRNRIKLTVTFIRESGELTEVALKKFRQYTKKGVSRWEEQGWGEPMTFTHFTFEKLLKFLKLLTELDLANITERKITLPKENEGGIDDETQEKMRCC